MRRFLSFFIALLAAVHGTASVAADLKITSWTRDGALAWTNAVAPGVVVVQSSASLSGPWRGMRHVFSIRPAGATAASGDADVGLPFRRLASIPVPATAGGFSNLVASFGILETVAGNGGGQTDGVSYWQEWYEGWPGSWASLSRPHFAMADRAGNIYIADKNSHSVVRVGTDGNIATYAGNHSEGYNGDGPMPATQMQLRFPNGLWVRGDGTLYILDTDNGRVRRVDTNGVARTLFMATSNGSALAGGRGLWVNESETLAYFGNETRVRSWTPGGGLKTLASGFTDLGLFCVETNGNLLVCDRGEHYVHRVTPAGNRTVFAGNGKTSGGGSGSPALSTALYGVRGIWPVPTGGHLLLTHDGCQLWYLDTAGIVRLLVNGAGGRTHGGDGMPFYAPEELRISEGRSVTMDYDGNILICESDWGYVRRIRFAPLPAEFDSTP